MGFHQQCACFRIFEDAFVRFLVQSEVANSLKLNRRLLTQNPTDDVFVQIVVRQEAWSTH